MNRSATYVVMLSVTAVLSGCGATAKMIAGKSQSEKNDVFTEVRDGTTAPAGFGDVIISANIKTHLDGFYKGESKSSAYGKESYPYLINIDGQAVVWNAADQKHALLSYGAAGDTSSDPEAGEGMKYALNKKVRLRTGEDRLFFGLPADDYYR
jgi:hypothetical protein